VDRSLRGFARTTESDQRPFTGTKRGCGGFDVGSRITWNGLVGLGYYVSRVVSVWLDIGRYMWTTRPEAAFINLRMTQPCTARRSA